MPQTKKTTRPVTKRTPKSTKSSATAVKPRRQAAVTKPLSLQHHVKRVWHLTPRFVHGAAAGAFVGIVAVAAFAYAHPAQALSISAPQDCDSYAIIRCGISSSAELQKAYANDDDVAHVYSAFNITKPDIDTVSATAVSGTVYDDGTVKVAGKVVAVNAKTAARLNLPGSTKQTVQGTTFYSRPISASFARKSVPAYVVMANNQFAFAIIASCGNPVTGTPVLYPTPPAPTPTPPTPAPTPPVTPPVTPPTPPPAELVSTPAKALPDTGPGALIVIAALSVIGGFIAHHGHLRHKHRKTARPA